MSNFDLYDRDYYNAHGEHWCQVHWHCDRSEPHLEQLLASNGEILQGILYVHVC